MTKKLKTCWPIFLCSLNKEEKSYEKKYAVVGLVSAILVASSFASTFSIKTNELSDIQIWKMFQFENSWMSENEEVVQEETKKIEHPMYFWIENNKVAYDNYVKISKFKAGV